jgi:hypothetical protein
MLAVLWFRWVGGCVCLRGLAGTLPVTARGGVIRLSSVPLWECTAVSPWGPAAQARMHKGVWGPPSLEQVGCEGAREGGA